MDGCHGKKLLLQARRGAAGQDHKQTGSQGDAEETNGAKHGPSPSSSPAVSLRTPTGRDSQGAIGKAETQSRTSKIGFGIKDKKLVTGTNVEDGRR